MANYASPSVASLAQRLLEANMIRTDWCVSKAYWQEPTPAYPN
ncbi:hypothetical protein [Pseudovibrio ascidiaceicola]|nr:hypothetical protein [Pseudovibrio ascidiaceicola]